MVYTIKNRSVGCTVRKGWTTSGDATYIYIYIHSWVAIILVKNKIKKSHAPHLLTAARV